MANYIENFNSKLDWAMPFQRTGKFPLDRSSMFDSYEDAVKYAAGAPATDSRGLGGSSYVGQLIVVFENDVVTVYKINADRKIEALTSESGVNADILELTTNLNAEIAARKAVDGQTGQTYAANTSAKHISAATSLNDADIKLNNAITAETKARQDAINALDKTISKTNDNFDISITQTDGLFNTLTISDIHLTSGYTSVNYPEVDSTTFTSAKANDTLDVAIKTVDQNVATLVQEVLNNEEVVAAAITKIKESIGVDENLKYVKDSSATFISEATTFSEADSLLDIALASEIANRQSAIDALDSTVTSSTTNVGVTVVQTNGKLESVTLTQTDIASAAALSAETTARKAVEGQTNSTYTKNTTSSYISGATSMNDADVKLDSAIKNLKLTAVTGTELTGLGENVKEAYKFIDGLGTKHGDYVKIYKDSSLQNVEFIGSAQTLNFTYILANGSTTTVPVNLSSFLSEEEYADGLQVNNHVISVKIDEDSESFLTVSGNGVKLSGVQNAINSAVNSLDSTITSDDTALVSVQVKQENGKITDVVVTGNDIDCGTF